MLNFSGCYSITGAIKVPNLYENKKIKKRRRTIFCREKAKALRKEKRNLRELIIGWGNFEVIIDNRLKILKQKKIDCLCKAEGKSHYFNLKELILSFLLN